MAILSFFDRLRHKLGKRHSYKGAFLECVDQGNEGRNPILFVPFPDGQDSRDAYCSNERYLVREGDFVVIYKTDGSTRYQGALTFVERDSLPNSESLKLSWYPKEIEALPWETLIIDGHHAMIFTDNEIRVAR